ncbi:FeoA family protein [Lentibacillus saliphilus]|uniref:FeoA family protein n=1 Tax=Lentibacillus saliphilus TaxID=2737028 RepID=UPI001C30B43A|nr:FeoA family protein [Lentibacillus saliphilus]
MHIHELNIGETAKIIDLSHAQDIIQKRLKQFGIHEQAEIRVKNKLLFGGPCIINCNGQCISLRKKDACCIKVARI